MKDAKDYTCMDILLLSHTEILIETISMGKSDYKFFRCLPSHENKMFGLKYYSNDCICKRIVNECNLKSRTKKQLFVTR